MNKVLLITGCLGFIGQYVTKACLDQGWYVTGIDSETYAADTTALIGLSKYNNFRYMNLDINDLTRLYDADYVINLAAESDVDSSIINSAKFLHSNINGVHNILRLIQSRPDNARPTLLQFSTDEVYGDIIHGAHFETDQLNPSNPYAATKASADLLIKSYHRTYDIPYLIVRPTNNYGIGQNTEKFLPKTLKHLNLGRKVPLHEQGTPVRTWLHVEDTANAILIT
jgi:dTDP-glucose 4,6-dehydratase